LANARSRWVSAALLVGAAAYAQPPETGAAPPHQHDPASHAALTQRPSPLSGIAVDFELIDRNGNTIRDEDFRGRHLLLAFGYTRCPDVCPLMAFSMGTVLQTTGVDAAGVFISVDTERDTPGRTDDYARTFDQRMLGLSGSYEQVDAAARNFRVGYAVTKTQNSYTVQHTPYIYVIDPDGKLLDVFTASTPVTEIATLLE
jgi:protein SCO1/2